MDCTYVYIYICVCIIYICIYIWYVCVHIHIYIYIYILMKYINNIFHVAQFVNPKHNGNPISRWGVFFIQTAVFTPFMMSQLAMLDYRMVNPVRSHHELYRFNPWLNQYSSTYMYHILTQPDHYV